MYFHCRSLVDKRKRKVAIEFSDFTGKFRERDRSTVKRYSLQRNESSPARGTSAFTLGSLRDAIESRIRHVTTVLDAISRSIQQSVTPAVFREAHLNFRRDIRRRSLIDVPWKRSKISCSAAVRTPNDTAYLCAFIRPFHSSIATPSTTSNLPNRLNLFITTIRLAHVQRAPTFNLQNEPFLLSQGRQGCKMRKQRAAIRVTFIPRGRLKGQEGYPP